MEKIDSESYGLKENKKENIFAWRKVPYCGIATLFICADFSHMRSKRQMRKKSPAPQSPAILF